MISSMTKGSSFNTSASYMKDAGVRPYFCSIIFKACS